MPLHLYLLRHTQSVDRQSGHADKERELTPLGTKNALLIGTFLQKEKIQLDIILTSPAERTKTTSRLVSDALKFDLDKIIIEDDLFEASTRVFLEIVNKIDDGYQHVLCVGHNPAISYLAEYLTQAEIGDMVPGGLAILKFNFNTWKDISQNSGELVRYIDPEMLDYRN